MRITLLGFSSSIGSLILESLSSIDPRAEVTIIENMPRADDAPFVPEGMGIRWLKADELTVPPAGPFLLAMAKPEAKMVVEKLTDLQSQLKELKVALSDYLAQYVTLAGTNQIELTDGILRQIIYTAKLVKKGD